MRLPNGARAIVDLKKLREYCLNPESPRGRHKARVFAAALGITVSDAPKLKAKLLEMARTGEAERGERDLYGQRYTMDFEMETAVGKTTPRLTTCYVKKRK